MGVVVLADGGSGGIGHVHDVPLDVGDVPVGSAVVFVTYPVSLHVVKEPGNAVPGLFRKDGTARQEILGGDTVYRFGGTDALFVVGVAGSYTVPVVAGQPPSVPGEGGSPVGGGVSDGVVDDAFPVVGGQLIRPVGVAVAVGDERDNSASERLYMLLQLFFVYSYRCSRSLGTISFAK